MAKNMWKNLDIGSLRLDDVNKLLKQAQGLVNKQMRRWEEQREYKSPAYYALKKSGGLISTKGKKTLQQKKKELARARRFLTDETRTFKGWDEAKASNTEALNKKLASLAEMETDEGVHVTGQQLSVDDYDRFFSAFEKAKEINRNIATLSYKYDIMDTLIEQVQDYSKTTDELALDLDRVFRKIYEKRKMQEWEEEQSDNTSDVL